MKYSVGSHNGRFGVFMEKAPGAPGHDFSKRVGEANDGSVDPGNIATEVVGKAERDR